MKAKPYLMTEMQYLSNRGNNLLFKMCQLMMRAGSVENFSPFSSRYPQPVTVMVAPAVRPKALGGRQTGLRLSGSQGEYDYFLIHILCVRLLAVWQLHH